jgi:hypothetical protein
MKPKNPQRPCRNWDGALCCSLQCIAFPDPIQRLCCLKFSSMASIYHRLLMENTLKPADRMQGNQSIKWPERARPISKQ